MSLKDNYQCEGQLTIFDIYSLDILFGRTSSEPSAQTTAKTSDASSKKPARLQTKTPMFLDLRRDSDGHQRDASWVTDIRSLGECMTHNTGEFLSGGDAYVFLLTTGGQPRQRYYLNFSEKPSTPRPSKLSQILESNPDPKYNLSPRACLGILNRAEKRGKELPELLRIALEKQAGLLASKNEQESQGGGKGILIQNERTGALSTLNNQSVFCIEGNGSRDSHQGNGFKESDTMYTINTVEQHAVAYGIGGFDSKGMKSPNPHAGIYKADTSRTLDQMGGSPACNQGGIAIVEGVDLYNQTTTGNIAKTLNSIKTDSDHVPCIIEKANGGGQEPTTASKGGFFLNARSDGKADTLVATDYKDPQIVCYGLDRSSFNQGQNALFDFSIEKELAQPLLAKGPGGGICETVGAICARDYKGVGNQYVYEGKCIIQYSRPSDTKD